MNDLIYAVDEIVLQNRYPKLNSVLLYRDGELLLERYYNGFTRDSRNNIKSIWKSILSLCLGICIDKGIVGSVDDPICRYLPEFAKGDSPLHKRITIRHLLTMSSGIYWNGGVHYHCPMLEQLFRCNDWLAFLADIPMRDTPGSKYVYKEFDVILLSALISKAAGMCTYNFCDAHLYKPLDIRSGKWAQSRCGIDYTISPRNQAIEAQSDLSAFDLAKIGQLLLDGGTYNGQRIVSQDYVNQATSPSQASNGYGYLFWLYDFGYSCKGIGGQDINIVPNKRIINVIQATVGNKDKRYDDIFFRLLELISD